jgi:hypothetical protein
MHISLQGVVTTAMEYGIPRWCFSTLSKLEILNRYNDSNYFVGGRQDVIDVTLGSYGFLEINTF